MSWEISKTLPWNSTSRSILRQGFFTRISIDSKFSLLPCAIHSVLKKKTYISGYKVHGGARSRKAIKPNLFTVRSFVHFRTRLESRRPLPRETDDLGTECCLSLSHFTSLCNFPDSEKSAAIHYRRMSSVSVTRDSAISICIFLLLTGIAGWFIT